METHAIQIQHIVAEVAHTQALVIHQAEVVPEVGMTIVVVVAEQVPPAQLQLAQVLIVLLRQVDADQAGLILLHALVKQLHHKGVITYLPQVAEADLPGMLLLVLAAQAEQVRHLPEQHLLLVEEPLAVLVLRGITGCLIAAGGACPMVQLAAAAETLRQPRRRQLHRQLLNLLLLQVNQHQPLVHRIQPPLGF